MADPRPWTTPTSLKVGVHTIVLETPHHLTALCMLIYINELLDSPEFPTQFNLYGCIQDALLSSKLFEIQGSPSDYIFQD